MSKILRAPHPSRRDKWVFGSQETGFYLRKFAWTKIVRHRMVAGRASPDDPALTGYWAERRRRTKPPVDTATRRLLRRQHGRCPLCRGLLLHADREPQSPDQWQQWLTATRKAIRKNAIVSAVDPGTPDDNAAPQLIHAYCRRRLGDATARHTCRPASLKGLLEPVARKRARPVLRGGRRSNAPSLPDESEFAALRQLAPNGTDHRTHAEQNAAISAYIRWHNHHAEPKISFAASSPIRSWTSYPAKVA